MGGVLDLPMGTRADQEILSRIMTIDSLKHTSAEPDQAVLGLNDSYHDSSFCISEGSELFHVEVERFTRIKYDTTNPILAFCELFPDKCEAFRAVAVAEGDLVSPLL